ncbi:MAG: DeoR/GlpR family DNA-binding transcription regulator [Armatimonadota bacterium]
MARKMESGSPIGAQRRRTICKWAEEHGSVNATELSNALGVAASTIRQDLDILHKEGKLIRSYGGALAKDAPSPRLPYSATRNTHLDEKSSIGQAALRYLPATGVAFIGAGSTTNEMVVRISEGSQLQVVTNCPRVAWQLMSGVVRSVHMLGGPLMTDAYCTDCMLDPAFDILHWDVAIIGMPSIDVERGMAEVNYQAALCYKSVIQRSGKVVMLADSSKFSLSSYATIGPIDLIDVLITDSGLSTEIVDGLRERGVEVVIAGELKD